MATIKRNVGEPMRLRLNLGDNASGKFIRAFLSSDGTPLPVPFANLIELETGLYGNNSYLMPAGNAVIDVKFIVYLDAGFTVEDPTYFSATDQYEIETFDASQFTPPLPEKVYAVFESNEAEVIVNQPGEVRAMVKESPSVNVTVEDQGNLIIQVKDLNEIEGVLNV